MNHPAAAVPGASVVSPCADLADLADLASVVQAAQLAAVAAVAAVAHLAHLAQAAHLAAMATGIQPARALLMAARAVNSLLSEASSGDRQRPAMS